MEEFGDPVWFWGYLLLIAPLVGTGIDVADGSLSRRPYPIFLHYTRRLRETLGMVFLVLLGLGSLLAGLPGGLVDRACYADRCGRPSWWIYRPGRDTHPLWDGWCRVRGLCSGPGWALSVFYSCLGGG